MLKRLVKFLTALTVLTAIDAVLIFAPAFAPVPRESAKTTAQSGDRDQHQSQGKPKPSDPLSVNRDPKEAIPSDPNSEAIAPENKQQQETTVTVRSLPQVSIAKEKKGFWDRIFDWGPWIFNGLLALVGIFQILLLKWTWDQIKRQADTMQEQATDAKESGKHTEELARQAVRQTELTQLQLELTHRPWIAIESIAAASDLVFNEQGCVLFLNLQIRNVGGSIAKHVINFVDYAVGGVTNLRDVTARVVEVLKRPIPPELDHGKLLFPGETDVSQYPVVIRPEHIKEALKSGHFAIQEGFGFELIVCFDYQSTIDPGVHHQTRRTYGVAEIPEGGGALMGIFRPAAKVYPAQRIAIFYRGYGAHVD